MTLACQPPVPQLWREGTTKGSQVLELFISSGRPAEHTGCMRKTPTRSRARRCGARASVDSDLASVTVPTLGFRGRGGGTQVPRPQEGRDGDDG